MVSCNPGRNFEKDFTYTLCGPNNAFTGVTNVESKCAQCAMRAEAEAKPHTFKARLWRWHTNWCPGWKAYQRELAQIAQANPKSR